MSARRSSVPRLAGAALAALLAARLAACGAEPVVPAELPSVVASEAISIAEPRVRLPPEGRDVTAAYLTLRALKPEGDVLIGASSPVARVVELHAHIEGADGMKRMTKLERVELAPDRTVPFTPGGLHLMLIDVDGPLEPGRSVPMTLRFRTCDATVVAAPIGRPMEGEAEGAHAGHAH